MKLETKFNYGNTVFFMQENKVHEANVDQISISVRGDSVGISYVLIRGTRLSTTFHESQLFETKEELLKSL